jgi:hypothetical protein
MPGKDSIRGDWEYYFEASAKDAHLIATISECRYRWLRLPALNLPRARTECSATIGLATAILSTRNSVMISMGPRTPKMSERRLKTPQDFPTSRLDKGSDFLTRSNCHFNDLLPILKRHSDDVFGKSAEGLAEFAGRFFRSGEITIVWFA